MYYPVCDCAPCIAPSSAQPLHHQDSVTELSSNYFAVTLSELMALILWANHLVLYLYSLIKNVYFPLNKDKCSGRRWCFAWLLTKKFAYDCLDHIMEYAVMKRKMAAT